MCVCVYSHCPEPFKAVGKTTALVPSSAFTNLQSKSVPSVNCSKDIPIQKGSMSHFVWGYRLNIYIFFGFVCSKIQKSGFVLEQLKEIQDVFDCQDVFRFSVQKGLEHRCSKDVIVPFLSILMAYLT